MDTGVVIFLILGGASIISSVCFGLIPGIRQKKIEKLENKTRLFAQDIDSFYAIEKSLLEQLSEATGENSETLKKKVRKQVGNEKGHGLSSYSQPSKIANYLHK